jgi:hypothetical protein
MPSLGGRTASGPWSRLKPVEPDLLESVGLPSKGETRLNSPQFQQRYYTAIVDRYLAICTDAGERNALLERFASLDLAEKPQSAPGNASTTTLSSGTSTSSARTSNPTPSLAPTSSRDLGDILFSLRKLREAIVATMRADTFAAQAYLFATRLAVLTRQPDSYHPALQHLLRFIHPRHPLTSSELREVVSYLVLDAACRRGALAEAYALRRLYGLRDGKVDAVLRALVADDWVLFWRVKGSVDGHMAALMDTAVPLVRRHVLKAFGRAYLAVGVEFLERSAGTKWDALVTDDGVGWNLDDGKVVIRKIQAKVA